MEDEKCHCSVNLSSESEYEYILNELELTRNRIDDIIKIIKKRTEKDALIDEILKCNCNDTEEKNHSHVDIEEIYKTLALKKMFEPYRNPYYPTYYKYRF